MSHVPDDPFEPRPGTLSACLAQALRAEDIEDIPPASTFSESEQELDDAENKFSKSAEVISLEAARLAADSPAADADSPEAD